MASVFDGEKLQQLREHADIDALISAGKIPLASLEKLLACSVYAADVLTRYPQALVDIVSDGRIDRPLKEGEYETLFVAAPGNAPANEDQDTFANESETAFMQRIRRFRHRELARIVYRDVNGHSDTAETLRELSALADACIRGAYQRAHNDLQKRCGLPRAEDGEEESSFVIMAMGKLGGGELNFSSDVDLVFLFSARGETDGERPLANEEYFRRLAQQMITFLSKKTGDGFVYRVDARLRPFGDSGPLACSVAALEDYLAQHGRDWERYAWVKARAVNLWPGRINLYREVLRPFVYRRYLDFGVFASLRDMKSMIEREGRSAENRENVKLGPGGIREIEFIVQTLQLVRGGTVRALRERSLMRALKGLGAEELLDARTVKELATAYNFLRDIENRLQAIADRQTHNLPAGDENRARLTLAMGYADWGSLYAALNVHRAVVQKHFEDILHHERRAESRESEAAADQDSGGEQTELEAIAEQMFEEPDEALRRISALRAGTLYMRMDEQGRQRLDQLLPSTLMACGANARPLKALDGVLRVIESIGRRSAYFALLNENELALKRLVQMCGSSAFLVRQISSHPLLLDELLDQRIFSEAPKRQDLVEDMQQRLDGSDPDDMEQCFESLRNFQRAAIFRVAVADLSGTLPLMKVSDRLTDTAELVLEAAIKLARRELEASFGKPQCTVDGMRREAGFAVAGYGKLGGIELGYGSDLDIVFLHDSQGEDQETDGPKALDNSMYFARLARRITSILTMATQTGPLYEVDTRLRPSGKSGLLVTSLHALDTYQKKEAWTWEHQALLRSRAVAGDQPVCEAFEKIRLHALSHYVRTDGLRDEVIKMRKRMRTELSKSTPDDFDLKQGTGGIIDIEFLVQYLVLANAPEHPELLTFSDNIRQLEALGQAGILTAEQADMLPGIYRGYRERAHIQSLAGEERTVPRTGLGDERERVREIWDSFLG